jgi:hypothetical protein
MWSSGHKTRIAHLVFSSMDVVNGDLRINSSSDMNCNMAAMSLPPVTSAVFLIAKSFW